MGAHQGRPTPIEAPVAPAPEPCTTCGPGKVRGSYFPSNLRLWEVREGGNPEYSKQALETLMQSSGSEIWLMLEDYVEFARDKHLLEALTATSTEAAAALTFRAQGVESLLRDLRNIRAMAQLPHEGVQDAEGQDA